MSEPADRVAICILTFRRPAMLRRLLEDLGRIRIPDGVAVKVAVVDNDAESSARATVDAACHLVPFPLTYVTEARRGIAPARNAAVLAAEPFDFLAFIDDDETPSTEWLEQLVAVQRRTGADVVTGTVLPSFTTAPPDWLVAGGFFERPRHEDGAIITYARTGNVLIAHRLLERHDPPFEARYGLSGGEDTHFFMRAVSEGARIAWADRAAVSETLPSERASWRWLLAREYHRGHILSMCLCDLTGSPARRARRAGHGALRIVTGLLGAGLAVRRGRAGLLRSARQVALGTGMLTGLAGIRSSPYALR